VIVVGGGLAGLCCARTLVREGLQVELVEASDRVGGRVRTDEVEGFRLDRGFQVLLDAYPAAREELDYEELELRPFLPGARVRVRGRFYDVADPWRRPGAALTSLSSPVGTLADKARVGALRSRLLKRDPYALLAGGPDLPTREVLAEAGFSDRMVETFFRPFLGGVFLDPELETTGRMFEFVFHMFSAGRTCLPALGMEMIPRQMADSLPPGTVRTGVRVEAVESGAVRLEGGERREAGAVVVATGGAEAQRLLDRAGGPAAPSVGFQGTTCVYFDAPADPVGEPLLVLNGEGSGPVNNLCVPSRVSRRYAPEGRHLVSVTVLDGAVPGDDGESPRPEVGDTGGEGALLRAVREHLRGWYGPFVDDWRHLRTYRIPHALPSQPPGWLDPPRRPVRAGGFYLCGDHRADASINGALVSGREAAWAVLQDREPAAV
jgi:phytoene dehydrogenase-like protein